MNSENQKVVEIRKGENDTTEKAVVYTQAAPVKKEI